MKINLNLIHSIRLQLQAGVKLSEIGFIRNSSDSKICNWIDLKGEK